MRSWRHLFYGMGMEDQKLLRQYWADGDGSLAGLVIASALSAASTSTSAATLILLTMTKAKAIAVAGAIVAAGVMPVVWQLQVNRRLQSENQALRSDLETLRASQVQPPAPSRSDEAERLARQEQELAKLRGALAQARRQLAEVQRAGLAAPEAPEPAAPEIAVTAAEVTAFLERPKVEQGKVLGHLRRQMMGLEKSEGEDLQRSIGLANAIRPTLEELESHPDQMADFQASFVQAAIGLEDEDRVAQIRRIVADTYQKAVEEKLDANSRPQEGVDAWALRRDALDRPATRAVEQLLTSQERARFGRAFLGIMGIDLGLRDGSWHRFVMPGGGVVFPSEQEGNR